jgi:hypothetical protein
MNLKEERLNLIKKGPVWILAWKKLNLIPKDSLPFQIQSMAFQLANFSYFLIFLKKISRDYIFFTPSFLFF